MAALLLDTTVLVDTLRGARGSELLRQLRRRGDTPYVCAISVDEVVYGMRLGEELGLQRLLAGLRLAPLGRAEGDRAGSGDESSGARAARSARPTAWLRRLRSAWTRRSSTGNSRDFPMPGLRVEHWPVSLTPVDRPAPL